MNAFAFTLHIINKPKRGKKEEKTLAEEDWEGAELKHTCRAFLFIGHTEMEHGK